MTWADAAQDTNRLWVQALNERDRAIALLHQLKTGTCWCGVGIDNPMCRGQHSPACKSVSEFLRSFERR